MSDLPKRDAAREKLRELVRKPRVKPEKETKLPPHVTDALHGTNYRALIVSGTERLAELESADVTAIWLAQMPHPLDEDPPQRLNLFIGEPMPETWDMIAARAIWYRIWKLEET